LTSSLDVGVEAEELLVSVEVDLEDVEVGVGVDDGTPPITGIRLEAVLEDVLEVVVVADELRSELLDGRLTIGESSGASVVEVG
jgi:hypothetical protein